MINYIFVLILIYVLCQSTIVVKCIDSNWPSEEIESGHRKVMEGQDVTITCSGRIKDAPAYWDYKACGIGINRSLCSEISTEELNRAWKPLNQNISSLTLKNILMSESGLYRCKHAATPFISIYTTIHLEVWPHNTDDDESLMFEEGLPKDLNVTKNSQAVFQCRVYSKTPINIIWAWMSKENEIGLDSTSRLGRWSEVLRKVPQMGNMYEPMGAPGEDAEVGFDGLHLNRLVLPRVRRAHAGRYFCIAFNATGHYAGEASAYLQVMDEEHRFKWYMFTIFLLPVGLIMVSLSMCFCFALIQKRKQINLSKYEQDYPDL